MKAPVIGCLLIAAFGGGLSFVPMPFLPPFPTSEIETEICDCYQYRQRPPRWTIEPGTGNKVRLPGRKESFRQPCARNILHYFRKHVV